MTTEGKIVSDRMALTTCSNEILQYCNVIQLDQAGEFIATVRYADGKEVHYGVSSTLDESKLYYSLSTKMIIPQAVVTVGGDRHDLVGDPILPKGSAEIATVTRDAGTNIFRITPKAAGNFTINFPSMQWNEDDPLDGTVGYYIPVKVEQIGPFLYVHAEQEIDY